MLQGDFMKKEKQNKTVVYQTKSGAIELKQDINANTVWAHTER
jgi:hypothetical protein